MPSNTSGTGVIDWSLTTWQGSRREQLRRWAKLSLEEIIQAQEDMRELSERFAQMRKSKVPPVIKA